MTEQFEYIDPDGDRLTARATHSIDGTATPIVSIAVHEADGSASVAVPLEYLEKVLVGVQGVAVEAAAPAAPADQAELRERIAEAIHHNRFADSSWECQPEALRADYRDIADAVLAVLPAPADQAAEIKQLREKYREGLRRADEANNAPTRPTTR